MIYAIIIYINPNDFLKELKEDIAKTAGELTLQYLNKNLKLEYKSLDDLVNENSQLNYDELSEKYGKMNELIMTVVSKPSDTLKEKIMESLIGSGIGKERIAKIPSIYNVISTLVGLFGQAFELKSISLILRVPLYITKPNVLMYLNCINCIDEDDSNRIHETNILFALYNTLKNYNFIEDYNKIVDCYNEGKIYKEIVYKSRKDKIEMNEYIKIIKENIVGSDCFKSITKKSISRPHLDHKKSKTSKNEIKH